MQAADGKTHLNACWRPDFDLFLSQKGAFMSQKRYLVDTAYFQI